MIVTLYCYRSTGFSHVNELHADYVGIRKSIDQLNPLPPVRLPRGYGGVGVMWHRRIDHLVTSHTDYGERIQIIELNISPQPLLLVSVYMPCNSGGSSNTIEFLDCLEQLHAIHERFSATHLILFGGDMNENITVVRDTQRNSACQKFIQDNSLEYSTLGKTFINAVGVETSAIDYFIYGSKLSTHIKGFVKMDNCAALLPDHYPILCRLKIDTETTTQAQLQLPKPEIKWNKIDLQEYACIVTDKLESIGVSDRLNSMGETDIEIDKMNKVIVEAAEQLIPRCSKHTAAHKLRVSSDKMKTASSTNKKSFRQRKDAGKPRDKDNPLFQEMKLSKMDLRKMCSVELAKQKLEYRQQILDTKSRDNGMFHKLLNRLKGKLVNYISELNVDGEVFKTEESILSGWHKHLSSLALANTYEHSDLD